MKSAEPIWPCEPNARYGILTIMAESFGTAFTLVEVTPDDFSARRKQLWVAAAKPDQALTLVLMAVPEGWTAELADGRMTRQQLEALEGLNLKPGEVRELTN
jgi:hypothetical protein